MSELLQHVERTILARSLLRRGQAVLVAVSGGVDSLVLLEVLAQLAAKHGWRLVVAHFNHQLRGRSSDADERCVQRAAQRLGLRFVAGRAAVRGHAKRHKLSVEMAARQLRHGFLARTARRLRIPIIALAHHADDQLETFFLRLLRGSGGEGLAGMKWRNPSPAHPAVELVRPMLDVGKPALREYAAGQGITFREDASNASRDIRRNRIRHELLPGLERRFGGSLRKTIPRVMEIVGAETEFVTEAAKAWLEGKARVGDDHFGAGQGSAGPRRQIVTAPAHATKSLRPAGRESFAGLPVAVQRRCLQLQLLGQGVPPDFDLIEQLRLKAEHPVSVGPETVAQRAQGGDLTVRRLGRGTSPSRGFSGGSVAVELHGRAGEAVFDGVQIRWSRFAKAGSNLAKTRSGREVFDADKVGPRIVLRHWRAGDRFQPIGLAAPVKLQDWFTNLKIGRPQRHRLVLAQAAAGEVFWVEGLRIAERFKLDKHTRRRLKWAWQRRAE